MCSYDCPEPSYYFYVTTPTDIAWFYPYPTASHPTRSISLVLYNPNGFILSHFHFLYPLLHPLPFYITTFTGVTIFPSSHHP